MKTPREVLLQRHEAAADRLDDARKKALAVAFPKPKPAGRHWSLLVVVRSQLWAVFQFKPQTAAAFATAWIVIFALKLATHDETQVASRKAPVSREVMAEVRQQKRFFAELVGLSEPRDADRAKPSPRPRSERDSKSVMV